MVDEEAMLFVVTRTSILCYLEVQEIENISCESIWAAASSRNKVIMDPELIRNTFELSSNLLCLINLYDFENDCCRENRLCTRFPTSPVSLRTQAARGVWVGGATSSGSESSVAELMK